MTKAPRRLGLGTQNREDQTHKIQKNVYSLLLFESIRQVIRSQLCVTVVDDEFQYIKRVLQRNMHGYKSGANKNLQKPTTVKFSR